MTITTSSTGTRSIRGMNPERYAKGTTFEQVYALYSFDQVMRSYFLTELIKIEKHIKSLIAYHFSEIHGYDHRQYLEQHLCAWQPNLYAEQKIQISAFDSRYKNTRRVRDSSKQRTKLYPRKNWCFGYPHHAKGILQEIRFRYAEKTPQKALRQNGSPDPQGDTPRYKSRNGIPHDLSF